MAQTDRRRTLMWEIPKKRSRWECDRIRSQCGGVKKLHTDHEQSCRLKAPHHPPLPPHLSPPEILFNSLLSSASGNEHGLSLYVCQFCVASKQQIIDRLLVQCSKKTGDERVKSSSHRDDLSKVGNGCWKSVSCSVSPWNRRRANSGVRWAIIWSKISSQKLKTIRPFDSTSKSVNLEIAKGPSAKAQNLKLFLFYVRLFNANLSSFFSSRDSFSSAITNCGSV